MVAKRRRKKKRTKKSKVKSGRGSTKPRATSATKTGKKKVTSSVAKRQKKSAEVGTRTGKKNKRMMNKRKPKLGKKRGTFPTILQHKTAMMILVDRIRISGKSIPKWNKGLTPVDGTWTFILSIWDCVGDWSNRDLAEFFKEVTGGELPTSYKTWEEKLHDVKHLINDIFWLEDNINAVIEPDTWKMWPGGFINRSKEENNMGFGKRAKKGSKKKASKKKVGKKKKVIKKTGAKKKVTKKTAKKAGSKKKVTKKTAKKAGKKKATGKKGMGQVAPLGTTDWDALPDKTKVKPGEEGCRAAIKQLVDMVPAGGITIGALLKKAAKEFGETKARNVTWRAVNRFYLKVVK